MGIEATSAQLVDLCERMREMMIVQYSQCLWFEGCRVYHLETFQCNDS